VVSIDDVLAKIKVIRDVSKGLACEVRDLTDTLEALKVFRDYVVGYDVPSEKMDKLNEILHRLESYFSVLGFGSTYHAYYNNWLNDAIEILHDIVENHVLPSLAIKEPDPSWFAPPEGWSKVWHFDSWSEVVDCFNSVRENLAWKEGYVYFEPPSGDIGRGERYITDVGYRRIAFCFRLLKVECEGYELFESLCVIPEGYVGDCASWVKPYETVLFDYQGGVEKYIEALKLDTWYVFVVDSVDKKLELYEGKNLVDSMDLFFEETTASPRYSLRIEESNQPCTYVTDVEVTWVAVRET